MVSGLMRHPVFQKPAIQTLELNRQDLKDREEPPLWINRSHLPRLHGPKAAHADKAKTISRILAVFEVFAVRFPSHCRNQRSMADCAFGTEACEFVPMHGAEC
jgi:hypothetical protein